MHDLLVVCFSRTGFTRRAAAEFQRLVPAEFEDIREQRPFKGPFSYLMARWSVLRRQSRSILPPRHQAKDFRGVVICTPNWAGAIAPPVLSWLRCQEAPFPPYALLVTQSGTAGGNILEEVRQEIGHAPVHSLFLRDAYVADGSYMTQLQPFARHVSQRFNDLTKIY